MEAETTLLGDYRVLSREVRMVACSKIVAVEMEGKV